MRDILVDGGSNLSHKAVALPADSTVVLIAAANPQRRRITLQNAAASSHAFIGFSATAAAAALSEANGSPLNGPEWFTDETNYSYIPGGLYVLYTKGAVYGFVKTGETAGDVRVLEETT